MNRGWHWWTLYGVGAAAILSGLGWISTVIIDLDRTEAAMQRRAVIEESARLALWNLDAAVAPLLLQLNRLPNSRFEQPSIWSGDHAAGPSSKQRIGTVVCFTITDSLNNKSSPELGTEEDRPRLDRLWRSQSAIVVAARAAPLERSPADASAGTIASSVSQIPAQGTYADQQRVAQTAYQSLNSAVQAGNRYQTFNEGNLLLDVEDHRSALAPLWFDQELLLVRHVAHGVQVAAVDWAMVRQQLELFARNDLPSARLLPSASLTADLGHRMALLPVVLDPGDALPARLEPLARTPVAWILTPAWAITLLGLIGGAALLAAALRLSERRGAFVSAVTHELRTPLTTFRLYADLLEQDMVPAGPERTKLLSTLRIEAERLSHLVENVLSYARLERVQPAPARPMELTDLLAQVRQHVADRIQHAGLEFVEDVAPACASIRVLADPAAVERILVNLVDNAGKYAVSATDRRLHLAVACRDEVVELRISDHGPGVSPDVVSRLFTPFSKSSAEGAQTAPGVGLGLALSQRLARQLGGDLRLDTTHANGAAFVLSLRRVA